MDNYSYPGTQTPKNKFVIVDFEKLSRFDGLSFSSCDLEIEDGYGPDRQDRFVWTDSRFA